MIWGELFLVRWNLYFTHLEHYLYRKSLSLILKTKLLFKSQSASDLISLDISLYSIREPMFSILSIKITSKFSSSKPKGIISRVSFIIYSSVSSKSIKSLKTNPFLAFKFTNANHKLL